MRLHVVLIFLLVFPLCSWSANATSGTSVDLYTESGGWGQGEPSGPFKVGELLVFYSEVKENGVPMEGKLVGFSVYGPSNPYNNFTFVVGGWTNSSGIAASNGFRIGPLGLEHWQEMFLGTWLVECRTELGNQTCGDSMTFEMNWDLTVDLYTQRGGEGFSVPSDSFRPGEFVNIHMRVMNRTVPLPGVTVEFDWVPEDVSPNGTIFLVTNELGVATLSFRLPWEINTTQHRTSRAVARLLDYATFDEIAYTVLAGKTTLGDVNFDGKVDMVDVSTCARSFGSYEGHSRWNTDCDLNNDGHVDMRDLATVAANFGKTA